jgi:hypothetical protein
MSDDLAIKGYNELSNMVLQSNSEDNFSEYFAEQFRQYVISGLAPKEVESIFEKFKNYLIEIVKLFKDKGYNEDLKPFFSKIISESLLQKEQQTIKEEGTVIKIVHKTGDIFEYTYKDGNWKFLSTRKEWMIAGKNDLTRIEQQISGTAQWQQPLTDTDLLAIKNGESLPKSVIAIQEAIDNRSYESAIINGILTAKQAVAIIESAGIEAPIAISSQIGGIEELKNQKNDPNNCGS